MSEEILKEMVRYMMMKTFMIPLFILFLITIIYLIYEIAEEVKESERNNL